MAHAGQETPLLQDLGAAGADPDPTLTMNPSAYDFKPPKVYAWNVGLQHKLWKAVTFDIAYVGSKSEDLLSQEQINAVPYGAKFLPENQDPTRPSSTTPIGSGTTCSTCWEVSARNGL